MPKVDSTAVDRIEYAPTTHTLDIWYSGGGHYRYFDVPEAVYRRLLAASSIGAFVNSRIKPVFRYAEAGRPRRRFRPAEE